MPTNQAARITRCIMKVGGPVSLGFLAGSEGAIPSKAWMSRNMGLVFRFKWQLHVLANALANAIWFVFIE